MVRKESGNKMHKIGNDDECTMQIMGSDVVIPESFPTDIPIIWDAIIYQAIQTNDGISLVYETMLKPNEVDDIYNAYFNKSTIFIGELKITDFSSYYGVLKTYVIDRKDGSLSLQIIEGNEPDDGTMILILFTPNIGIEM